MKCRKCNITICDPDDHGYEDECWCGDDEDSPYHLCLRCQELFLDLLETVEQYTFTVGDLLEYDDESVN
jgi:hypothetical protein